MQAIIGTLSQKAAQLLNSDSVVYFKLLVSQTIFLTPLHVCVVNDVTHQAPQIKMCVLRIYDSGRSSLHELLCSCRLNVLRRRSLLARKLTAELHNILADLQITAHLKMLDFIHVSPPWLDCFPCTVYLAILKILTLRQFWFCVFFFFCIF